MIRQTGGGAAGEDLGLVRIILPAPARLAIGEKACPLLAWRWVPRARSASSLRFQQIPCGPRQPSIRLGRIFEQFENTQAIPLGQLQALGLVDNCMGYWQYRADYEIAGIRHVRWVGADREWCKFSQYRAGWALIQSNKASSIRVCQSAPVARK